ncbi:hypothetical protein, partial [Marinobacter alexandrii]|uniref:hypothetical protein n=1 Tax=Marinobacter alexandrii TaxID=2570351 RepID=UPI00329EA3CA
VIGRDLIIVGGAICYRLLIGSFTFGARPLSKLNMIVQIFFCILILATPLYPSIPENLVSITTAIVIVIAITSGLDYIVAWTKKAQLHGKEH